MPLRPIVTRLPTGRGRTPGWGGNAKGGLSALIKFHRIIRCDGRQRDGLRWDCRVRTIRRLVPLLDLISDQFSTPVRARGREYYLDGCVHSLTCSGGMIRARGSGTQQYSVRVDVRQAPADGRLECDCPFMADRDEPCKHLWAALLEANSRGLLEPDESTSAEASDDDEPQRAQVKHERAPTWQRHIRRLRDAMGSERFQEQRRGTWPADRRLVYIIDVESTHSESWGVVLELWTQAQGRDGSWNAPKRMTLDEQDWLAIPDETDRRIAHLLLGA